MGYLSTFTGWARPRVEQQMPGFSLKVRCASNTLVYMFGSLPEREHQLDIKLSGPKETIIWARDQTVLFFEV